MARTRPFSVLAAHMERPAALATQNSKLDINQWVKSLRKYSAVYIKLAAFRLHMQLRMFLGLHCVNRRIHFDFDE